MSNTIDFSYPAILTQFEKFAGTGRTESASFLAWFLENYYRLEVDESQDSICDGPDDKGIDGVYVDANFERIDVLQSKLYQNERRTLGDSSLKEFAGTLGQFSSKESVLELIESTGNVELSGLLKSLDVVNLVSAGWDVRGVFVTNARADPNARAYLEGQQNIIAYDLDELVRGYIEYGPTAPVQTPVEFDISGFETIEYKTPEATAYFAPLLASELVALDGLQSGELFEWNVRQSLGRTKINKAISSGVKDQAEHKNFPLYHNGLTVLCSQVSRTDSKISMAGYSVVNGCQSLTTLHQNRAVITDELRILTRIIELPAESELAAKITRHSNNQNAINARDLQSNSTTQRRLQIEVKGLLGGRFHYEIKRGDAVAATAGADVISNEDAARSLLAFDLKEPWLCHQSYRLFDDLHTQIFSRPEVTGERIVALHFVFDAVLESLELVQLETFRKYRLSRYFVLYLLRQVLESDEHGRSFCSSPESFLREESGDARIVEVCKTLLGDIIVDLNAEIQERSNAHDPLDFKRELKSPTAARPLAKEIVSSYQKLVARGRVPSFGTVWNESKTQP